MTEMYYEYAIADAFEMLYGAAYLGSILVSLAFYVVRALSVQTIAKRRGLSKPWLAWIPVANDWLMGSISDQYKYLTQEKEQSRRKILLGLSVTCALCGAAVAGSVISLVVQIAMTGEHYLSDAQMASILLKPMMGILAVGMVWSVVGITTYVFRCLCRYDLYKSCDPKNATAYLVLGILFNVAEPFFLLACRKKDLGMPPRKPVYEPREPWEAPEE